MRLCTMLWSRIPVTLRCSNLYLVFSWSTSCLLLAVPCSVVSTMVSLSDRRNIRFIVRRARRLGVVEMRIAVGNVAGCLMVLNT